MCLCLRASFEDEPIVFLVALVCYNFRESQCEFSFSLGPAGARLVDWASHSALLFRCWPSLVSAFAATGHTLGLQLLHLCFEAGSAAMWVKARLQ